MIIIGKINVLDSDTANKIAAGEVVERPSSVVKELVENSIDAKSTEIKIIIKEAGLNTIIVKDDGEGLESDDVERAFLRHATSKIRYSKDLFKINSLGFRGEALPSIAAVSRVTLRTSANESGYGTELKIEGGKILSKNEIAYSKGTEIIVEDIFYNTPARLKYMKTLQTELGHIIDYINSLSLSYPNISFTLIHNEHLLLRTNGDNKLLHVLAAIYGTNIAKNMLPLENQNLDYKIRGFISKPEITRANKNHISVFINGRYIKNYLLNQAIIKGYKTRLMVNRFPVAVLMINMDPALVDVNVHPAKLEARFSKERDLMRFIEETLDDLLRNQLLIKEPFKNDYQRSRPKIEQPSMELRISNQNIEQLSNKNTREPFIREQFKSHHQKDEENNAGSYIGSTSMQFPVMEPIGQLEDTYIIAQGEAGLYLIDQHAAHERIQYEKNLLIMNEDQVTSQELLVPLTIELTTSEIKQIENNIDLFRTIGITLELFGLKTLLLRSVPQWIPKGKEKDFIEKIIQMILVENRVDEKELRQDLIAGISCKSAIKARKYLTKREMEALIEQLEETNNPFSCPHGRPTIIHFSFNEIEKMFKRVI